MIYFLHIVNLAILYFRSICMYKIGIACEDSSLEYAGQVWIWLWSVEFWQLSLLNFEKNRNCQFPFIISAMVAPI